MKRVAAIVLLLALAGCGGADVATAPPAAAPSPEATPTPTASPTPKPGRPKARAVRPAARCLPVKPEVLERIAGAAEPGVGTMAFSSGAAVRAPGFDGRVYLIAGRFNAPGVKGVEGVWASNSLEPGGGLTLAVDGAAKQFTVLPDADKTPAMLNSASDGVREALSCL